MDNPLSKVSSLIPIIEKIASDKATEMFNKLAAQAQYTVPKVPDHHHNSSDSSTLGIEALDPILEVPANSALTAATSGVVSIKALGNQIVRQDTQVVGYGTLTAGNNFAQHGAFWTCPIPVIFGNGGGADSAFNGGTAPAGTVIFFDNGPTLSGLWICTDGTHWRGSAGSTFNLTA